MTCVMPPPDAEQLPIPFQLCLRQVDCPTADFAGSALAVPLLHRLRTG
jgi:hypothetical protein